MTLPGVHVPGGPLPHLGATAADGPMLSTHPTEGTPRLLGSSTIMSSSSTSAELPSGRSGLGGDGLGKEGPAKDILSSSPTTDDEPALAIDAAGLPIAPKGEGLACVEARRMCACAEPGPDIGETPIGEMAFVVGVPGAFEGNPSAEGKVEEGREG